MIQVSDAYKNLMNSNVRPRVEPVIKVVTGKDSDGNDVVLEWQGKDIKDMTYRRHIDPAGRELPYMELEWTQIYKGELNSEGYPKEYRNITKYMLVNVSFKQNLSFFNTWKILYDKKTKWSDLLGAYSWKSLKNSPPSETINLPPLLLEARPTFEGITVKWKAYDLLYFLDDNIIKSFDTNIDYFNPFLYFLINQRGRFSNVPVVSQMINTMINKVQDLKDENNLSISKRFIVDSPLKEFLRNYANLNNFYWDFDTDGVPIMQKYAVGDICQEYPRKLLYSLPKITQGTDISAYSFKHYTVDEGSNVYKVKPVAYEEITLEGKDANGNDYTKMVYRADFEEYGKPEYEYFYDPTGVILPVSSEIDHLVCFANTNDTVTEFDIRELKRNAHENIIRGSSSGEVYSEDNPVNPYSKTASRMTNRNKFLRRYFKKNQASLDVECLPNVALTTGDAINVETGYYNEDGSTITKKAIIVGFEMKYSGDLREKIMAHEVAE